MVSTTRKEIIIGFMEKAKKEVTGLKSGFNQGFKSAMCLAWCWFSFEAFTCVVYKKDRARERIEAFCSNFSDRYFQDYESMPHDFKTNIIGLMGYSVGDMRPTHLNDPAIKITSGRDLNQVLDVIYRARNNLFHGGKDMNEEKDMNLVTYASVALYYILEKFLREESIM
jgi:hypothetical protein